MAVVNSLYIKLMIQRLVNRGPTAAVIDVDGANPRENIVVENTITGSLDMGPIDVSLAPLASITIACAAPLAGTNKQLIVVQMDDNPVQVGIGAAPSGLATTMFVSTPNGAVANVQLTNPSATLTANGRVFLSGT